jgi:hypothetical protein
MEKFWRFYDEIRTGISGVVIADSKKEAVERAVAYINAVHNGCVSAGDITVWKWVDDVDYNKSYPFVLAISY